MCGDARTQLLKPPIQSEAAIVAAVPMPALTLPQPALPTASAAFAALARGLVGVGAPARGQRSRGPRDPACRGSAARDGRITDPRTTDRWSTDARRTDPRAADPGLTERRAADARIRTIAAVQDKMQFADRTDEALLTASIDGDRSAFAALVERYRDELLHFLIRFLGSRSAADDVFQEAFLQVHLSARSFDASRRFKPWLFTIAANKARDHFRRNHRQPPLSLSATMEKGGDSDRFVDLLADDQPGPDMPVGDAERSSLVRRIVDQMPPHHREILLLSYFQRMSYNQIADCLSIPLGTVKSRLHAAVANFAGAWRASQGPDASELA